MSTKRDFKLTEAYKPVAEGLIQAFFTCMEMLAEPELFDGDGEYAEMSVHQFNLPNGKMAQIKVVVTTDQDEWVIRG